MARGGGLLVGFRHRSGCFEGRKSWRERDAPQKRDERLGMGSGAPPHSRYRTRSGPEEKGRGTKPSKSQSGTIIRGVQFGYRSSVPIGQPAHLLGDAADATLMEIRLPEIATITKMNGSGC